MVCFSSEVSSAPTLIAPQLLDRAALDRTTGNSSMKDYREQFHEGHLDISHRALQGEGCVGFVLVLAGDDGALGGGRGRLLDGFLSEI